jgi:hypothetical protein
MNVTLPSTYRVGSTVRAKTLKTSPISESWMMKPSATSVLDTAMM